MSTAETTQPIVRLSETENRKLYVHTKDSVKMEYGVTPAKADAESHGFWGPELANYALSYINQKTGFETPDPQALKARADSVKEIMGDKVGEQLLRDTRQIADDKLAELTGGKSRG